MGDGSTTHHRNLLLHKNAFMLATQINPRIQAEYKVEFLGDLVVVDTLYGVAEFRDNHGVALYSPDCLTLIRGWGVRPLPSALTGE